MKTIVKFCVTGYLVIAGFGYTVAQSAASSSKDVISTNNDTIVKNVSAFMSTMDTITEDWGSKRGIPTPPHITTLIQEGKIQEALNEFETFKTMQQKKRADAYDLLYCEMTIYEQLSMLPGVNKEYAQKMEILKQEIITKYPNRSDSYTLQIELNTPTDKVIELATKAIELDKENVAAYNYRGTALFKLGKIKEACADLEKVPWKNNMPEYQSCNK